MDRSLTVWSNGGKHEGIIREGEEIVFRTGLTHNNRSAAQRAALAWNAANPQPDPTEAIARKEATIRLYEGALTRAQAENHHGNIAHYTYQIQALRCELEELKESI